MYSVLIVDDEEPVLDSYAYIIERAGEGFSLAGKARSGYEAMRLMDEKRPDVVFMDISMPGIDGIETIARVHDRFPDTVFILSTAYERFDLAQRAIPLGVFAYLVKPVTKKLFTETLEDARAHLDRRRKERPVLSPDAREREFLRDAVWAPMSEADWERHRAELGIPSDRALVAFVELERENSGLFEAINRRISFKHRFLFSFHLHLGMYLFVEGAEPAAVEEALAAAIAETATEGTFSVLAAGPIRRGPALHESCEAALASLRERRERAGARIRERLKVIEIRRKIGLSGDSEIDTLFRSYWEEVFSTCEPEVARAKMIVLFSLLLDDATGCYGRHTDEPPPLDPAVEISGLRDQAEWERWCAPAFALVRSLSRRAHDRRMPAPLTKALSFVDAHFAEPIQLTTAADAAQGSPAYLSRLFSEHMGTSFVDYLTVLRVERAERLLHEGAMSVKEVSFAVGYQDPNYFSKIFRKVVGMSPSLYAERS